MADTINIYEQSDEETNEKLNEVVEKLVGEDAVPVVNYLRDKEHISEFIVAEELDMEIHEARTLLYRLLEHNLVSFKRKKDKTKGWYICYWDLNEDVVDGLYKKLKNDRLDELRERLNEEEDNIFYMCGNGCMRVNFEKAMEIDFKCMECGELMEQQDNSRTVEFLREKIEELEEAAA
jgi:transcription initiation factor TFIIE subunit alpha